MQTDKYIVHSYEVYTAPESLEDRLPYLDPPFTSDINPHQVRHPLSCPPPCLTLTPR